MAAKIRVIGDRIEFDGVPVALLVSGTSASTQSSFVELIDELRVDEVTGIDWDMMWAQIDRASTGDLIRHSALKDIFDKFTKAKP